VVPRKIFVFRDVQNDKKRISKKILVIVGIILGVLILIWLGTFISGSNLSTSNHYPSGRGGTQSLGVLSPSAVDQLDFNTSVGVTPPVSKEAATNRKATGVSEDAASRMVIKSGSLSMVVKDVAKTAKDITEYTKEKKRLGG
jgi:hypothetical protein